MTERKLSTRRRVRVSLGLKPLKAESSDRKKKEHEADAARREDAAKAARAAELKERVERCCSQMPSVADWTISFSLQQRQPRSLCLVTLCTLVGWQVGSAWMLAHNIMRSLTGLPYCSKSAMFMVQPQDPPRWVLMLPTYLLQLPAGREKSG